MKKILTIAVSLFAVSAFAAGVVFKANPLELLSSSGGEGDNSSKKAKVEQARAGNPKPVDLQPYAIPSNLTPKEQTSILLNQKRAATNAQERIRINAELIRSGNIRHLTPQEIEEVKKSGALIRHHDTGWQEVAAEQPKTIDPEHEQLTKFSKEEISTAPQKVVRVAYDENGNVKEKVEMNRLQYLQSPTRFTKEDNQTEQKNKK